LLQPDSVDFINLFAILCNSYNIGTLALQLAVDIFEPDKLAL